VIFWPRADLAGFWHRARFEIHQEYYHAHDAPRAELGFEEEMKRADIVPVDEIVEASARSASAGPIWN
jgi:hypothetical protein